MPQPTYTPQDVVDCDGELIAFQTSASSEYDCRFGAERWTEISVWYLHKPILGGKQWLCQVSGMSTYSGERNKRTAHHGGTLESALRVVDETTPIGASVAEQAREWATMNQVPADANRRAYAGDVQDDAEAMAWLYKGTPDEGHAGFVNMLARDMGVGESTIRAALKAGREVKVPLMAVLPFLNRAAFLKAREARRG